MVSTLKLLRIKKDLKQIEVAAILNINQSKYSDIESNKNYKRLSIYEFKKLADLYNMSFDELFKLLHSEDKKKIH